MRTSILTFITALLVFAFAGCEIEPPLHVVERDGDTLQVEFPNIDIALDVYWDYRLEYGIEYDWQAEWFYDWDDEDRRIFDSEEPGYTKPEVFHLRRYLTQQPDAPHTNVRQDMIYNCRYTAKFEWGFWDLLIWNDIHTSDGIQSLIFDEATSLDYVTAYTNQSMNSAHYNAPAFTRAFYQPEELFSAYDENEHIREDMYGFIYDPDRNVWVKQLNMKVMPITYIYLTQVILHNNRGKISNVDGNANLSGMARSVCVNTGIAGSDQVTVGYNVRLKKNCKMYDERVDIAGGRLLTFGMANINPNHIVSRGNEVLRINDGIRHYMDVTMQFNNGADSTFIFDVTDQVQRRYKGGVLTVELDMDTIPVPSFGHPGSGFDATVEDPEEVTKEFEM